MKAGIHPNWVKAVVTCSCGETFETHSIRETLRVDVCSKCHPFFTGGRQQRVQRGRVERFQRRYGRNGETGS